MPDVAVNRQASYRYHLLDKWECGLVLTGTEDDTVLVNDPAGRDEGTVARRYPRAELQRAWLERTGVGYVLFAP